MLCNSTGLASGSGLETFHAFIIAASTLLVGGALHFTEHDYFQDQIVKFVVMKDDGATSTARDREFTDWNTLAGFVDGFIETAI